MQSWSQKLRVVAFLTLACARPAPLAASLPGGVEPAKLACSEVISQYIALVKQRYRVKNMVINETEIGTFVVPQNSFVAYLMLMQPATFSRLYTAKERDVRFACVERDEDFEGAYRLY